MRFTVGTCVNEVSVVAASSFTGGTKEHVQPKGGVSVFGRALCSLAFFGPGRKIKKERRRISYFLRSREGERKSEADDLTHC